MRLFIILSYLGFQSQILAQIPQINGFVTDKTTGEAIQGAIISDSNAFFYTYSNKAGYYNLGVSSGKHLIQVTATGYERQSFVMGIYNNTEMNIALTLLPLKKNDTFSNVNHTVYDYRSGHVSPLASQVKNMPAILCEADPVKYLQFLPGVNGGIEGLSGMYVRGGNADQNLQTMDGLPIYGNGHLFGFLSNYNPGQVRDIQFYRGVAPARYGGRAGSVTDVSMLDGSQGDPTGSFEADFLALKFNLNGRLSSNGKWTYSLGCRRSWIDLLLPKGGNNSVYYNFHDLNTKLTYRPNKNDKISFWVYNGRDKFYNKNKTSTIDTFNRVRDLTYLTSTVWQNTLAGSNWNHKINNRLMSNFSIGMSRFKYKYPINLNLDVYTDTSQSSAKIDFNEETSITDLILKTDFEYNLSSTAFLRFGLEGINHFFKPTQQYLNLVSNGNVRIDTTLGKANKQVAQELSVYGEWEKSTNAGLKLNVGGRVWMFSSRDKTYVRPEPRILLSQILQGQKALKLGFSISNQGLHQLSSVNANLPNDVWFPISKNFIPQQNMQITGGFYQPWKNGVEFSADVYYKWMKGITDIKSLDYLDYEKNYWENMVTQGKGRAYGLELMAMKKTGYLNGIISYTFSRSDRTIPDINQSSSFPFRWDRRHKLAVQGVYHFSKSFMLNMALVIMTGNAVSVPTGKYVAADGSLVYDYSNKNNFRMPLYKRFDIGFKKEIRPGGQGDERQFWGINIYNFFNFHNPLFVNIGYDNKGVFRSNGVSFFPFLPTAFYSLEF